MFAFIAVRLHEGFSDLPHTGVVGDITQPVLNFRVPSVWPPLGNTHTCVCVCVCVNGIEP